ncbi:MAG: NUDIX domain-containing protein [Octadecabacter sp.]|nr:NUDIX domain-containing protein [Octadecabacter sp.]
MNLFIFGTLLHLPLLEIVSGDPKIAKRISSAMRPEYRVSRVEGHVFPMMHADKTSMAEGVIIEGLDDAEILRLDYYEKAFNFARTDFVVLDQNQKPRDVTAYVPPVDCWTPAEPWDRKGWIATYGGVTTMTAIEAMTLIDIMPAEQMGKLYPNMMARSSSRQRAAISCKPELKQRSLMGCKDVQVIDVHNQYTGFFNVDELDLKFRRYDGSMSDPVNRAVCVGVDCSIVLPYDPVRDRVMLVEQFRIGAFLRGDPNPWTIEPIAGRIDSGEGPEDAARREALEEAGIIITDLKCVSAAYPSPGSTTEYFFIYIGMADLPDGAAGAGGKLSESEDILSHIMDWADFDTALNAGEFRLLPLLVAGHWLARNRDNLRASA